MRSILAISLAATALVATRPAAAERLAVFASIEPVAGLVERVGGERVDVSTLVGPGASPVTYEPTARQLVHLQKAGMLFTIGVPFERGLVPRLRRGIDGLRLVPLAGPADEAVGDGHAHGEVDPHVWLDPIAVADMADVIARTLGEVDPAGRAEYERNAVALQELIAEVHEGISRQLAPLRGRTLLTYHPAYGHFTRRYGLHQIAIEEDGREPGPRHLAEVLGAARRDGVEILLVQPQHPRRSAEAVARELGIPTLEVDPLDRDVEATWHRLTHAVRGEKTAAKGSR